jgi:two-component system, chemotaxis family, chemotaxis protein CheY
MAERVVTVDVDAVQDGMKAADNIVGLDGTMIVHKGVVLQTRHLNLLKHSHVQHISVILQDKSEQSKDTVHISDYPQYLNFLEEARILVVDDSKYLRFKLSQVLEQAGLKVIGQATNGKEAVDVAEQMKPNVITLDVEMPEFDGIYALTELHAKYPEAAIVMVSSVGEEEKILEAIGKGAIDFINKPIDPVNTVKSIITAIVLSRTV